jgi:hypothetical protein
MSAQTYTIRSENDPQLINFGPDARTVTNIGNGPTALFRAQLPMDSTNSIQLAVGQSMAVSGPLYVDCDTGHCDLHTERSSSTTSTVVYSDTTGWAARPSIASSVAWYGPLSTAGAPAGKLDGDVVVDTAATSSGSGSFEQTIGVCRTYTDATIVSAASRSTTAGRTVYMRLHGNQLASTGAAVVVAASAASNIAIGLYSNAGTGDSAQPGPQKATTGSVACPAAGFTKIAWSGAGSAGVDALEGDWLGIICDDGTTTRFLGNATLFPRTEVALALALATANSGSSLPTTPSGVFASDRAFVAKVLP